MRKSSARVSKSDPKGTKSEPKGAKSEPKGSQSEPKGAKRDQNGDQNQHKINIKMRVVKRLRKDSKTVSRPMCFLGAKSTYKSTR